MRGAAALLWIAWAACAGGPPAAEAERPEPPLLAGFARVEITPRAGGPLVGYGRRRSTGVRDPLFVRALAVEREGRGWCLFSLDLVNASERLVARGRKAVASAIGLEPGRVFVAATHTHSGPPEEDEAHLPAPIPDAMAEAARRAWAARRPARLAAGYGCLQGHTVNRRWLHRPVDPAVTVVRFDDERGRPLGLLTNFACHGVVLGEDTADVSADWPGYAMAELERGLGEGAVCLFTQGGAGDVNPLTPRVRAALESGRPVQCNAWGTVSYYGPHDPRGYHLGRRSGDTAEEAAALGRAFAAEARRVAAGLRPASPAGAPWMESRRVAVAEGRGTLELAAAGIGDWVLVGIPGEIFSETSVLLRREIEKLGFPFPVIAGYANGAFSYIPPPDAFAEGGYEVRNARAVGFSEDIVPRLGAALKELLQDRKRR
jgi:hypothetical protein